MPRCLFACERVEVIAHNADHRDGNQKRIVGEEGPVLIVCCPKQLLVAISLWLTG